MVEKENALVVFEGKGIRRLFHNGEWWYSVVDIIGVLTESANQRTYWKVLKHRLLEDGSEVVTKCNQLKMPASDGKYYETDCATVETMFRIIQSIPSPKAEPFKLWLARVGHDRVQEIQNPELAQDRVRTYYELKGYPKDWIEKRLRGIVIRQELTDEWKERKVGEEKEFAILTNEISKATFGKTVQEYKEFKGLQKKNENLRDHMNDWELIFTMIGEKATTDITKVRDSQGFKECEDSARVGGRIAHNARSELESETKKSIVSNENFLDMKKKKRMEHQ